jgi:hypothetical protein
MRLPETIKTKLRTGGACLHWRGLRLRIEVRNCGKPNCSKCPHGPYVYGVDNQGHRVYLGRL